MPGIDSTYISTTSFSVVDDNTDIFSVGRAVRGDNGVDGYSYGTISSSSYTSNITTVNLNTVNGALTSNLVSTLVGIQDVITGSLPDHSHLNYGQGGTITEASIPGLDKYTQAVVDSKDAVIAADVATNSGIQAAHAADSTIHFVEAAIDHGNITGLGGDDHTQYYNNARLTSWWDTASGTINHDTILNNHNLTTDIDHDALTNYAANEHFLWATVSATIDHDTILNYSADEHFTEASIQHSNIADDEAAKHRLINDSGDAADELWSASKITAEIVTISGKLDDHNEMNNLDYASAGHIGFLPTTASAALSAEIDSDITTHTALGDAHHNESHNIASHSDTSATGAELNELTDGSDTVLHNHDTQFSTFSGTIDHNTILNNHNLTTDIDHDALTNFETDEHFIWATVSATIDHDTIINTHNLTTDIDHGSVSGLGDDDHSQYHNDTRGDARYYQKSEVDAAFVTFSGTIDHDTIINTHNLTTDIDHDQLTNYAVNEHFLWATVSATIDHDTILNYSADEHFTQAAISITNSQVSDFTEGVQDVIGTSLSGINITITYDDASGITTLSGATGGGSSVWSEPADDNLVAGDGAGANISAGDADYNFLAGKEAGAGLTTGDNNVAIGYQAMYSNSQATDNVCIGYKAGYTLQVNALTENIFIGRESGHDNTNGNNNICLGYKAGYNQATGDFNILFGTQAGNGANGHNWSGNVAIGYNAGLSFSNGGDYNTYIGYYAGRAKTTSAYNVFIGNKVGDGAGTGDYNIMIGDDLELPNAASDNQLLIGNATYPFLKGDMSIYALAINGANGYLNFNTTTGSGGYGFRDNAGSMEYKDNGGPWTTISGGVGSHTITSHSDIVDATGAQIEELTGGGDTTLHDHDGISENTTHRGSDGSDHTFIDQDVTNGSTPVFTATNITGGNIHAESHTVVSHSDTTASGSELDELTGGGDTTLHDHDGISENTAARHTQNTDDKIIEGNSSIEVLDPGTGSIRMNVDGTDICTISGSAMKVEATGTLEVVERLVIPLAAPSVLVDGAIWIAP